MATTQKVQTNKAAQQAAVQAKAAAAARTAAAGSTAGQSATTAAKALTEKLKAATTGLQASKGASLSIPKAVSDLAAATKAQATEDIKTYKAAQDIESGITIPGAVYQDVPVDDTAEQARQSAYDLLYAEFSRYGLSSLVEPLKGLITENISPAEFSIRLQQTPAYQTRFAANKERIAKGLTPLSPADYIGMEDQYQNIMRNYGLPASYYTPGTLGVQEGFTKLLANDVSAGELEDRINTAQSRVINANPEVKQALKAFYPEITDGEILAYTLDPTKALTDIKRKVTAAEIGGAALAQGLQTGQTSAEQLASYGVTKAQAQQGYQTIADVLPVGQKLSQIYGESPYTQQQAEQEVFNLADSAAAAKKRKRLAQMEQATFGGSSGTSGSALSRDRALSTQSYREPGAGAY